MEVIMKKFFKNICIVLALILLFSFFFSCTSNRLDVESLLPESLFEPKTEESESSLSTIIPDIDPNPFSNVTMACIGSSSTLPTKVDRAYPTVVQELLGLKKVYNYGLSWSTLAYKENCHCHPDSDYNHDPYVFRYSEMEAADIIVVQGGGHNDYGCLIPLGSIDDVDPTTFYGGLNILIEGLKNEFPNSYILFMTSFDTYNNPNITNGAGVLHCDYADAILQACKKHNIDCLDIYHNMPFDRENDTVDGIHPTQEYIDNVWSPMIADFIRENYKK